MNGIWNLSRQEFIFFPALVIISKPLLSSVHNDIWETVATPLGIFIIIRDLKTQKANQGSPVDFCEQRLPGGGYMIFVSAGLQSFALGLGSE